MRCAPSSESATSGTGRFFQVMLAPPAECRKRITIDSAGGIESRQGHGKNGAALGTVMASQLTQMPAHDAMRSAEAEPDALTDRLGGVERLEHLIGFSNTATIVGKQDLRLILVLLNCDHQAT